MYNLYSYEKKIQELKERKKQRDKSQKIQNKRKGK